MPTTPSLAPELLLPLASALVLYVAAAAPAPNSPLLARFADDAAALSGAVAAGGTPISLPGPGLVVLRGEAGLAERLRAMGALRVTRLAAAAGCAAPATSRATGR